MIKQSFEKKRENRLNELNADLVVVGGGLAGVCAAIVAARENLKVILVQDRPVLGGNSSSEVRLWALGATSHMGNNNRWSREGGLINEILLDNLKRNKEGNPLIFDTILLEKVYEEKNITLLLNTSVYETFKTNDNTIKSVRAFCSQNSTTYVCSAPLFCDASGDGIVAFQAGASFRMGAETIDEFDEGFAPNIEDYGNLLGHSLYFYTKDFGKPISYTAPSFAIDNADELPRIKNYKLNQHGCNLWWVEYGGRLDTIHQSEDIKFELWKVVYGIWDFVKNSGKYPEAENLTLEWVGTIPGKRESRRFEGDYMLNQKDIVEQIDYYDRVAFGGWAMDLHPADGIYSEHNSCTQWHGKGVYSIPYRSYYSKDINNLFIAGRIISASHVAFGSSRVMLTCAHGGQAVGMAAAICIKNNWNPRQLSETNNITILQSKLNLNGQSIPRLNLNTDDNLVKAAIVSSSSNLKLETLSSSNAWQVLKASTAQLLPLKKGEKYTFTFEVKAEVDSKLEVMLKHSNSENHYTPNALLESETFILEKGVNHINYKCQNEIDFNGYSYLCFMKNENVSIRLSNDRITGVLTVQNKINEAVSNFGRQDPPSNIGIESFEFWTPERRPLGKNIAMDIHPPLEIFEHKNISNGLLRPTPNGQINAWVASLNDEHPVLELNWVEKQQVGKIKLFFDADFDHSMESTLMGHPESEIPFIVRDYKIYDENKNLIFEQNKNYQAINEITLKKKMMIGSLKIVFSKKHQHVPVSLFKLEVYE